MTKVTGVDENVAAIEQLKQGIKQLPEKVADELSTAMNRYVHVRTGFLKSTIWHRSAFAGASAPYAGYEADRGGSHDFPQLAIDEVEQNLEQYVDELLRNW